MGTIELNNKVMELKELKAFKDEIQKEIDLIEDQLKTEMIVRCQDEMEVGVFKLRYKLTKSSKFDTKRFKADHADLYEAYKKPSEYMRFTVN